MYSFIQKCWKRKGQLDDDVELSNIIVDWQLIHYRNPGIMIDMLLGAVYEWFHFVVVCELWLFYPIFFNELADDDDDCIIMGFFTIWKT